MSNANVGWLNWFANPRLHWLKKSMFEVLKERYAQNEQVIERVGVSLTTENDMNAFLKMIADIYEIAYLKAVNDHREQLEKVGLVARVVSGDSKS
jgi:hypothetical protein